MSTGQRWMGLWGALGVLAASGGMTALSGCDSTPAATSTAKTGENDVYLVGYVYDGATGMRLPKTAIDSIAIEYRDTIIKVTLEDDGRYVSQDPLPTWQDYMVTIVAGGYRAFVSRNGGFDVPPSLAMTAGVATASTTQTFAFDAYVFPKALQAPAMTITVGIVDDATAAIDLTKAAGTIRFRPQSVSGLQVGASDGLAGAPRASRHVWANDEDLLTQTLTKTFTGGKVSLAKGDLVFGIQYELSIYDVDGYQPLVLTGASGIVAGTVETTTITLKRDTRDTLKLIADDATSCAPPLPTATTAGAVIHLTFSENVEVVGTTYPEDIDNALSIQATSTTGFSCPLKMGTDPTKQERGTKVDVSGAMMTFSFTPSVGLTDGAGGTLCAAPTALTSVVYGGLSTLVVQPVGDPTRKRALSTMLLELNPSTNNASLSCPTRVSQ